MSLTFDALREANVTRLLELKDSKGEKARELSTPAWCMAALAKFGLVANLLHQVDRGTYEIEDIRQELANELADCVTYLDILAYKAGVDLGEATARKWNATSKRSGSDLRISSTGESVIRRKLKGQEG